MAPATEEPKAQIDARGVLIMVVALGAIVGLWVNEFRTGDDGYTGNYVYQAPRKAASKVTTPEPQRHILLTVEDCGQLVQNAVKEYVQRHADHADQDNSGEDRASTEDDEAASKPSDDEPAITDRYRDNVKVATEQAANKDAGAVRSDDEHEDEPATGHVDHGESEEEADEEGDSAEQGTEEEESGEEMEEGEEEAEEGDEEVTEDTDEETEDETAEPETDEQEEMSEEASGEQEEEEHAGPRSRKHIAEVLGFRDIGSDEDKEEDALIQKILQELKKLSVTAIQPMEKLYKFKDVSARVLGDAEIFNKPLALFMGPWSAGKSSIINYLLGTEHTKAGLKTGPQPTDIDFTVVHYADKLQRESGTEMAAHWAFSSVQKFGQGFLDHFKGIGLPHPLLQKVTIVDTPGILDKRKVENYPFNDAFQWFIDRADAIYVVFDPSKVEIGEEMAALLDQLKGREMQTRFLLNKADFIQPHDIMRITGQLLWNVSPLLGSSEAPIIHAVSMTSRPYHAGTPTDFFQEQELALLEHLREVMDERVENTIAFARRHAVRVRNHAKLVDCYLSTFYKQKGIFGSKRKVNEQITKDPNKYNIFESLSRLSNVSRYDLPDPQLYYKFFKLNPVYEFKPLTATCTYFKGCPLDKLDIAIAYDLPQLLGKYNDQTKFKKDREKTSTDHVPVPMGSGERPS